MSQHFATIKWQRNTQETFNDNQYSRAHTWHFDGGVVVPGSSSPLVIPPPLSEESHVDPEEAFVAAISSCHMLTFLGIAAKQRYVIDAYIDNAIGIMQSDKQGHMSVTKVTLKPEIVFLGDKQPSLEQLEKMHYLAHQHCFIANSVKTEIVTEVIAPVKVTQS